MRASWLALGLTTATSVAEAQDVIVFPLEPLGVDAVIANDATRAVVQTLRRTPGVGLIERDRVEQELGVGLSERARACAYDPFCLVELAELTGASRVLFGHVRRLEADATATELELRLAVVDVAEAAVGQDLVWTLPDTPRRHVDSAARAAARQLLMPPNARVEIRLTPPNARLYVYGRRQPAKLLEGRFWSGAYRLRVEADGYRPWEGEVVLVEGPNAPLTVELVRDPLMLTPSPGDTRSLVQGSPPPGRSSAFAKPIPWLMIGVGVASAVLGSVLMKTAQDGYNELAAEARYGPGRPATAPLARDDRDGFRAQYTGGTIAVGAGIAVVAGGLTWMTIDSLSTGQDEERRR